MVSADLLIENIAQGITFQTLPLTGARRRWQMVLISDACVVIQGEKIIAVGKRAEVLSHVKISPSTVVIDAHQRLVTPGLIDSHTHPIFLLTREKEFEMRIQGKTYEEIAAAGGGIRSSVRSVRKASKQELKEKVRSRLCRFLELGTTTIEAKSGYGLSLEDEVKSLEVIAELNQEQALEMVPTFLGAHEIPDEYRKDRDSYLRLLIEEMIPYVAENGLAEFCDVFCEHHVYTVKEARQILLTAKRAGLRPKLHADQLHLTGATQLAVELEAVSADHLEQLDPKGVQAIAGSGTVAGLLPGAVFFLGSNQYPPARTLLDVGAMVALATDFNPGSSMTQSLPLMMTLGCLYMKMTPAETLAATTIAGAKSLGRENNLGNLAPGFQADVVIWEAEDFRQLPYYYGVNLAHTVIKKGTIVFERNTSGE